MGRNNDNINKAYQAGYTKTLRQLKKWNLKFHTLIMGKPTFDIFVDDKAYGYKKNWKKKLKKYCKKWFLKQSIFILKKPEQFYQKS